jgi:hypothetical protein
MNGLLNIQKKEEPDVLFVCETKLVEAKVEWLRWNLNMPNMTVKDRQSGGLAMFWKNGINVRLIGFKSEYHLDTEITKEDVFVWRFMGIYGEPKTDEKEKKMAAAL